MALKNAETEFNYEYMCVIVDQEHLMTDKVSLSFKTSTEPAGMWRKCCLEQWPY